MPNSSFELTRYHQAPIGNRIREDLPKSPGEQEFYPPIRQGLGQTSSIPRFTLIPDRGVLVRPILSRPLVKSARAVLCESKPEYGCDRIIRLTSGCLPQPPRRSRSDRVFSNGAWFKAIENTAVRCIWRSQFAQNLILQRPRHGQGDGKNLSHLSIRSCFLKGKKTNLDVVNLTVVCKKCCEISHCKGNPNRARLPRKSRCIHDKSCLGATFGAQGRIMQGGYPENESKCKNPKD